MFRHPKYYKELRKLRNKLDKVISDEASTEATSVHPDPGLKQQAASDKLPDSQALIKFQATSIMGLDYNKTVDWMFHVKRNLVW